MHTIPKPEFQSAAPDRTAGRRYGRRRLLALGALLVVGVGIAWFFIQRNRSTETALPEGVEPAEFETARAEFEARYRRSADEIDVLSWLAEKSVNDGKLETAVACFERIPTAHPLWGRSARHQQGNVLMLLNRAAEAERQLQQFIELERTDPRSPPADLVDAIQRLRYLLEIQLRFEERRRLIAPVVRAGNGDVFDVISFCFPSLLRWNGPAAAARLERFWRADPDNLTLRIALGRYRTGQGRLDEAAKILAGCLRDAPKNLSAVAALDGAAATYPSAVAALDGAAATYPSAVAAHLALLRERGEWDRIADVVQKLPPPSARDPWLLLLIRGQAYNHQQEHRQAIRCFQLVLQSDPANAECCLGLAAAYAGLGKPDERKRMLAKANVLARIQNRLGWGQSSPKDVQPFIEIAERCEQIELFEQGLLIARLAIRNAPDDARLRSLIPRLEAGLR